MHLQEVQKILTIFQSEKVIDMVFVFEFGHSIRQEIKLIEQAMHFLQESCITQNLTIFPMKNLIIKSLYSADIRYGIIS
jgi:hypothetical protein